MPDTFIDFKKQRYRWAFGAMQIMRRHIGALLPGAHAADAGQRYHFVAGWLPWLADGINLLFNMAALAWSLADDRSRPRRPAADDLLGAAAVAVRLQAREAAAPVPTRVGASGEPSHADRMRSARGAREGSACRTRRSARRTATSGSRCC
jgi:hypothetical protein